MIKQKIQIAAAALLLNSPGFTADFDIVGTISKSIALTHGTSSSPEYKTITFMNVKLSDKARQDVIKKIQTALINENTDKEPVTKKYVQLGMNGVPVLDQGQNGTCVTFATTEAVDAILNKGNYISQLCLLQLGNYLHSLGQDPSGWDGSWGASILGRINQYGIISLKNQKKHGCGGYTNYPYDAPSSSPMTIDEYSQYSEPTSTNIFTWTPIPKSDPNDPSTQLERVKMALQEGDRVVFGVILPRVDEGTSGAVGWHYYFNDTWVLSSDILESIKSGKTFPGHEMVITGFDDTAVAMDFSGKRHHGLLTLRNSWGYWIGDWGDFYMTYDYFNALVNDANRIHKV